MLITHKRAKGLSLISLLIGITLGTFIILMILQVFAASRSNFQLAKNISEMNDVLRYASIVMNDIISQAGYRTPDGTTGVMPAYSTAFQPFNLTLYGPTGSAYNTTNNPNSDDPAGVVLSYFPGENVFLSSIDQDIGDKLWVKFQGDPAGRIRACNDLYGVANTAVMVRFYSRGSSIQSGGPTTGYYCELQNANQQYVYSDIPSGTPLIPPELFDQAWVRYGEDITGNGFIDRWSLGDEVQDRNRVYAVRVAFLIHTRDDVRSEAATQTFYVFDQTVTRTDQKIHKLYMFTVLLPNAPNYVLAQQVATP
jgi:hypothetical protein